MRLRSLLFVPGDSEHKFTKASGIGADALILDLEDAVAPPRKALAREMVKDMLGGPPRDWAFLVRINPLGSALTLGDLAAIVRPGLDGILIPKVNGIQDVELISNYVDVLEVAAGVTPGHVKLLVVATETPAAMIGLASYAAPSRRLIAMTWGAEDLGAALGALSNKEADELHKRLDPIAKYAMFQQKISSTQPVAANIVPESDWHTRREFADARDWLVNEWAVPLGKMVNDWKPP